MRCCPVLPIMDPSLSIRLRIASRIAAVTVVAAVALSLGLGASACNSNNSDPFNSSSGGSDPAAQALSDREDLSQRNGISDTAILFGQSAAFSGPAWELGTNMQLGIQAAFEEINNSGGVHGRELNLVSLDDAYEPEAAIENTFELIEENQVFALIGAVGTPTSRSAVPVASDSNVPYVAPFTGAAFLRESKWNNVINLRASYNQETEEMVARLTEDLGIDRIAVLFQDDSFGRAGLVGATRALERRGMEPVAVGFYPRNTLAVKTALLDLQRGKPEAVILVGAYQPVATLIVWARRTGLDAVFITISFVGSNALAEFLGPDGEDVLVTQVVPFPSDESIPIVRAYQDALRSLDPSAKPGWVSLEGYIAGRLAISGLDACGADVTRDCFLDTLQSSESIDLDGFMLQFGFADNQGSDKVFLTAIGSDGSYQAIENLRDVFP
ncbi:MAG: ABC transporter substrate-binding protein [Chloroflexi bacterium]|nr:ABC transporter substrate-binding protein [Chloroflexota bacterium]